jgi:uncharacterized protein YqgC (DUF456 family)
MPSTLTSDIMRLVHKKIRKQKLIRKWLNITTVAGTLAAAIAAPATLLHYLNVQLPKVHFPTITQLEVSPLYVGVGILTLALLAVDVIARQHYYKKHDK